MTSAAAAQKVTLAPTGTQAAPCTALRKALELTASYGHQCRYSAGEAECWDVPHQTLVLICRQLFVSRKCCRNAHAVDKQAALWATHRAGRRAGRRGATAGQSRVEMAKTDFWRENGFF